MLAITPKMSYWTSDMSYSMVARRITCIVLHFMIYLFIVQFLTQPQKPVFTLSFMYSTRRLPQIGKAHSSILYLPFQTSIFSILQKKVNHFLSLF